MKCPVCSEDMRSMVCSCGYDESRNYEKYPALGWLPGGVESVAAMRERRKSLIRCGGCGNHGFSLNYQEGKLCCLRCGRALTEGELKPLTDALGMKKPEPEPEKPAAQKTEKSTVELLSEFSDLLNVLKAQASVQDAPKSGPKSEKPELKTAEASNAAKQTAVGDLLNVLKSQASKQEEPKRDDSKRIVSIAEGYEHTVALYADGTAAAVGSNQYKECNLSGWRDIVAIAAGYHHTVGLKKDGTVLFAGFSYGDQKDVERWKDIIAIATGTFHTVGLKRDGTVVAVGDERKGKCDVSGWRNIQAVAAGYHHTLGLDKSGRVLTAGKGKGTKLPLGGWKNVKAVAAGYEHSVALTEDGKVLIAGDGGNPAALGGSVVEIGAGWHYTVVRKADGTAAACGVTIDGRCDVGHWTGLEKLAVGRDHVVGLKKDGTLVATGENKKGQCDVHKLMRE